MYIFTASKYAKVNIDDVKYNNVDKLHGTIFVPVLQNRPIKTLYLLNTVF